MNDKKFVQGAVVGVLATAMIAIAIVISGCATMQPDIPVQKAVEHDTLKALNAAQQTYKMYSANMPENERAEALKAINKVYHLLKAYKALKDAPTADTMELIQAKDAMIDILAATTGVQ